MLPPTSGLARLTIRAPRRRLDLAVPHQVPLAELLPEVLRRAGEVGPGVEVMPGPPVGGWMLRRGDGAPLAGDAALAPQGVRDGDVLYLVPRNLSWPEPAYDDIVEEIAAGARSHGRSWGAGATRLFAVAAAALLLVVALAVLATLASVFAGLVACTAAVTLLVAGTLLSRAGGDGVTGAAAAMLALPPAAAGAAMLAGGPSPERLLVAAAALLFAAAVAGVAVGHAPRVFVGAATAGLLAAAGAVLAMAVSPAGAAAIMVVVLVGSIGLAPLLAVRLGKLPLPAVTAAPEELAAERRPDRPEVLAAVVRADEILTGTLLGIGVAGVAAVAVLAAAAGPSARILAALAAGALMLRARLFPAVAARLPLLLSGLLGLAGTAWSGLAGAGVPARLAGLAVAFGAMAALLAAAAVARRPRPGGFPHLGRLADVVDIAAVVALAPVACAVLNLYGWLGGLIG